MAASCQPSAELAAAFSLPGLRAAYERVAANRGAPGVDRQTVEQFGAHLDRNLARLAEQVLSGSYRPGPVRRVYLPKRSGGFRPLGIPTVRDRVAQAAVHQVAAPECERLFLDCSYAYRPERSIFSAIDEVERLRRQGLRWVAEGDIVRCFDSLAHDRLVALWEARFPAFTPLVRSWVTAPSLDGEHILPTIAGVPQGGVISPLLCNLYLHEFDCRLTRLGHDLVRYADDFVLLAADEPGAHAALRASADALSRIDLQLSSEKSAVTSFDAGFIFLGARFQGDEIQRPHTGRYGGGSARKSRPRAQAHHSLDGSIQSQPIWLSRDPDPPLALPISAVADFAFCPRSFYLRHLCGERIETPAMRTGRIHHRIHRMAGGGGVLYFDIPVASERLRLRGRLDAVYAKWNTWVPVECKFSQTETVHQSHRLQLAAQAIAIEETTGRSVLAGYIQFLPRGRLHCVAIDDELRGDLAQTVEQMWEISAARTPPPERRDGRCWWCSMRPVCQPDLAESLETIIA